MPRRLTIYIDIIKLLSRCQALFGSIKITGTSRPQADSQIVHIIKRARIQNDLNGSIRVWEGIRGILSEV
ncbi:hypothetical protein D3C77_571990 [compost metagenome]